MVMKWTEGKPQEEGGAKVVPFASRGRLAGRRMVMVPEDEWREVLQAVREWRKVRTGCPIARRIVQEE